MSGTWTNEDRPLPAVAVTSGPRQHYFGYYDKSPFSADGRHLLALECDVLDRLQEPDDTAVLGMVDFQDGNRWTPLAETRAWSWQMGCMSLWLPGPGRRVIYNDRREGRLISVVLDIDGDEQRVLPRPVACLSPDGRTALSLNFARARALWPETGYCGAEDPWPDQPAPADDGIFRMDVATGESTLIVSHRDVAGHQPVIADAGAVHYFSHLAFNADGGRLLFWYRGNRPNPRPLYTANADGTAICRLVESNSHSVWLGRDRILVWMNAEPGPGFYLVHDRTGEREVVAPGVLDRNSHASFSPDGEWILTDRRPPQVSGGELLLLSLARRRCYRIGDFPGLPQLTGPLRCDLHPRWSDDGSLVCIDSTHGGGRQMYVIDVGEVVGGTA